MGFNLDIGKMKFLKSDEHSTTLQHPKGHTVTIAHNVLSPKNREALQALSKVAMDAQTPERASEYGKIIHKMAKGGKPALTAHKSPGGGTQLGFDSGGKVPVPDQPNQGQQDKQEYAKKIASSSQQGTSIPDTSTLVDRIKNAWAEGGQIEQMRSQHGGEGNETCKACGGPIHRKMAAGGDPAIDTDTDKEVNDNEAYGQKLADIANVKGVIPYQPEESPLSMDMAAKRQQYNDIVKRQNTGAFWDADEAMREQHAAKDMEFGPNGEAPKQFDPKAWDQMQRERDQAKDANATQMANEALNTAEYNKAAQAAGLPPKPTQDILGNQNTNDVLPAMPAQSGQQPQTEQAQSAPADMFGTGGYNNAVNELAGIEQKQLGDQIQNRQSIIDNYQKQYADLENERQAHIQDIQNGQVNPDKYWENHSKLASGLGMILAGFNPTNRPNAAIEFVNNQINRSIDAQKANLNSQHNLLAANLQQFGNLHQATLMTSAMMNDVMANKAQQAALQAKNPLAKQAALGAQAQFMQQAMMFQRQLAMQRTMMGLAQGGGDPDKQAQAIAMAKMVMPEYGKTLGEAFVPGVGLSKSLTPIPEEVRQQIASSQKLQNAIMDLQQYSKTHTNIIPGTAEYNVGVQKSRVLQQMVREGMLGTVFRESEKPLLAAFVADNPAGALKRINSDPKLRTLLDSSIQQSNILKQNYGLPTQHMAQQRAPATDINAAKSWLANPANRNNPNYAKVQQIVSGR